MHRFKKGDIITTYNKGIWIVTEVKQRFMTEDLMFYKTMRDKYKLGERYSDLVCYSLLCDENGKKGNRKGECDELCCEFVEEFISTKEKQLESIKELIKNYRNDCR